MPNLMHTSSRKGSPVPMTPRARKYAPMWNTSSYRADAQRSAGQQRLIGPPSALVVASASRTRAGVAQLEQLDRYTLRRLPGMRVEHVGGQAAGHVRHSGTRHAIDEAQAGDVLDLGQRIGKLLIDAVGHALPQCAQDRRARVASAQMMKGKPNLAR